MESVPVSHILIFSSALFFIGVYGFLSRQHLIMMLMSMELMLNSVNINFIAFNKYIFPGALDGLFFTLFIITIAAAEAAVAIAIILNLYRNFKSVKPEDVSTLKY
ncbi:MAG: NADH-quinone oxidoreductase subunit NuoK [Bacteroidia bacterium]